MSENPEHFQSWLSAEGWLPLRVLQSSCFDLDHCLFRGFQFFSSLGSTVISKGHFGKPSKTSIWFRPPNFLCAIKHLMYSRCPSNWVQEWWDRLILHKFLQSCSVQGNTDPLMTTGLAERAGGGGHPVLFVGQAQRVLNNPLHLSLPA